MAGKKKAPLTRAERKAATRAALIDAGERLIRKKGFRVSVDDIAAEAGFTKGAVYSNFASRAELMLQICERVIPGLQVDADPSAPTLAEALEGAARQMIVAATTDSEQIVLQLDWLVQMLRDTELREALVSDARDNAMADDDQWLWPLPLPKRQWRIAINAVALGLLSQRLLFGEEEVPDELFVWLNRRLAGD